MDGKFRNVKGIIKSGKEGARIDIWDVRSQGLHGKCKGIGTEVRGRRDSRSLEGSRGDVTGDEIVEE